MQWDVRYYVCHFVLPLKACTGVACGGWSSSKQYTTPWGSRKNKRLGFYTINLMQACKRNDCISSSSNTQTILKEERETKKYSFQETFKEEGLREVPLVGWMPPCPKSPRRLIFHLKMEWDPIHWKVKSYLKHAWEANTVNFKPRDYHVHNMHIRGRSSFGNRTCTCPRKISGWEKVFCCWEKMWGMENPTRQQKKEGKTKKNARLTGSRVGDSLCALFPQWQNVTQNQYILDILKHGCRI